MAEDCKCIMLNEFKHIAEDMTDRKNNERDMLKNISDIRTNQERTMFETEQVRKAQELQSIAAEKNQASMDAGFKTIEDRRNADEKAVVLEKKEIDKEKVRLKELQVDKDEAIRLEKKDDKKAKAVQTWGIFLAGIGLIANFIMGMLFQH